MRAVGREWAGGGDARQSNRRIFRAPMRKLMALKQMMGMVRLQAAVMSYADVFLMLDEDIPRLRRRRHHHAAAATGRGRRSRALISL